MQRHKSVGHFGGTVQLFRRSELYRGDW